MRGLTTPLISAVLAAGLAGCMVNPGTEEPQGQPGTGEVTTEPAEPADSGDQPDSAPTAPAMFNDSGAEGTYDCGDKNVLVNGAGADLHLVGTCRTVTVNGASAKVEIDVAETILVNGANARVIYHRGVDQPEPRVVVNGRNASADKG